MGVLIYRGQWMSPPYAITEALQLLVWVLNSCSKGIYKYFTENGICGYK